MLVVPDHFCCTVHWDVCWFQSLTVLVSVEKPKSLILTSPIWTTAAWIEPERSLRNTRPRLWYTPPCSGECQVWFTSQYQIMYPVQRLRWWAQCLGQCGLFHHARCVWLVGHSPVHCFSVSPFLIFECGVVRKACNNTSIRNIIVQHCDKAQELYQCAPAQIDEKRHSATMGRAKKSWTKSVLNHSPGC